MKFAFASALPSHLNNNVRNGGVKKSVEIDGDIINQDYYPNVDISLKNHCSHKNIYANRYNDTSKRFKGFFDLVLQWNGSVFKLIWHNLLIFMMAYTFLAVLYNFILNQNPVAKEIFELMCIYCGR